MIRLIFCLVVAAMLQGCSSASRLGEWPRVDQMLSIVEEHLFECGWAKLDSDNYMIHCVPMEHNGKVVESGIIPERVVVEFEPRVNAKTMEEFRAAIAEAAVTNVRISMVRIDTARVTRFLTDVIGFDHDTATRLVAQRGAKAVSGPFRAMNHGDSLWIDSSR